MTGLAFGHYIKWLTSEYVRVSKQDVNIYKARL